MDTETVGDFHFRFIILNFDLIFKMGSKSEVWNHMTKISKSEGKCKLCDMIVRSAGNTTNYWNHLKQHKISKSKEVRKHVVNDVLQLE